jgi:hypothetical protein
MSFRLLLRIVEAEVGEEAAKRIERRARAELAPVNIYVGTRERLTAEDVRRADPDPRKAARKLGVHFTTAYRLIR